MSELRDLVPRKDPKGGSPRTPTTPIPLSAYQQYVGNGNGNGTVWKVWTALLSGMLVSMTVAYFTALRGQGVSQKDMQEYVDRAFAHDRELISLQNSTQDEKIGSLMGHKDRLFDLINKINEKDSGYDRDIQDQDRKIKLITDYMEAEKNPKR